MSTLKEEIKDKIQTLKVQMKEDGIEFRSRKKELRMQHRELRRINKTQIKTLKKQFRKEFGSSFSRIAAFINNKTSSFLVNYYTRCAERGEDLKYAQRDPDGREAELVIQDIDKVVKVVEKRLQKEKPISEKTQELLISSLVAVKTIREKNLGRHLEEAVELESRILGCLDAETVSQLTVFETMEKMFHDTISNIPITEELPQKA